MMPSSWFFTLFAPKLQQSGVMIPMSRYGVGMYRFSQYINWCEQAYFGTRLYIITFTFTLHHNPLTPVQSGLL